MNPPALSGQGNSLAIAYAYCERLARAHYENFPVASRLLPPPMRQHFAAIYAFARRADDFADEPGPAANERLRLLEREENEIVARRCAIGIRRGQTLLEPRAPRVEPPEALAGFGPRFVREVVGAAREGIDCGNMRAYGRRQQKRGDGEVLVVVARETLAIGVGHGKGVPLGRKGERVHHSVSEVPARRFAARAMTKSRSESRFT